VNSAEKWGIDVCREYNKDRIHVGNGKCVRIVSLAVGKKRGGLLY